MTILKVAALLAACVLVSCATSVERAAETCPPRVVVALDSLGRPTPDWIDAIRDRVSAEQLATIAQTSKPLSTDEIAWRDRISEAAGDWCASVPRLNAPFRHVTPPRRPRVLLGNQGGGDGFTRDPDDVAIDLSELTRAYAGMAAGARPALIRRLLSHEYTHLLLHRWMDATGWSEASVANDPFRRALRTLYNEGIANLRSVEDGTWVSSNGALTSRARETLVALQPVMLERLQGLSTNPSPDAAARLLRNISQGPPERKWGAMPIALWLEEDTGGDPARLAAWIEAKPNGILDLAVRHADPQYRPAFARLLEHAAARALESPYPPREKTEKHHEAINRLCALPNARRIVGAQRPGRELLRYMEREYGEEHQIEPDELRQQD